MKSREVDRDGVPGVEDRSSAHRILGGAVIAWFRCLLIVESKHRRHRAPDGLTLTGADRTGKSNALATRQRSGPTSAARKLDVFHGG